MASQLFFGMLLTICWQAVFCQQNTRCDLSWLPQAPIQLQRFAGTWYEIKFAASSTDLAPEDIWTDYSEVYTMDIKQPQQLNRTFNYRDPRTGRCSSITSKYPMTYLGNGAFSIKKFGINYTSIVATVDRAYQYAVIVECSEMLPTGECTHIPDVKVMHRNRRVASTVNVALETFFRSNIPCVRYSDLMETVHSSASCVRRRSAPVERFMLQREMPWFSLDSLRRVASQYVNMF